ncbi:MAG: peptidylprolyl isomerase [Bacilli bacterium]|nr:peptidylprolyl isomerase [Bacilli bacterium]
MKKKNIVLGLVLVLGSVLLITGCGKAKLKNGEEVVASVNGKNITADDLYKALKEKYAKQIISDEIDKKIFNDLYKDDEEIEKQVNSYVEYIKSMYPDNWEKTLKNAGYESEDSFKEEARLNYQREKAVDDYLKENIKEDEIKKYYDEESVGDIKASHILIKVKTDGEEEGLSDEEAKAKAEDLIKQLDEGADFAELAKANSDDPGSAVEGGNLGFFNKGAMVAEFEKAAYALKVNEYTKEPVKTTYGYHIILKTEEAEKQKYEDVKENIITKLLEKKKEEDNNYMINTLKAIRSKYKLKFDDSGIEDKYNEYIDAQLENSAQ